MKARAIQTHDRRVCDYCSCFIFVCLFCLFVLSFCLISKPREEEIIALEKSPLDSSVSVLKFVIQAIVYDQWRWWHTGDK